MARCCPVNPTRTRPVRRDRRYTRPLSVRLTPDQLDRLEVLVEQRDRSRTALIREAVDRLLETEVPA